MDLTLVMLKPTTNFISTATVPAIHKLVIHYGYVESFSIICYSAMVAKYKVFQW